MATESSLPPGIPITIETATAIRTTLFASVQHTFDQDWRRATFTFQSITSPCPYGIRTQKHGSRGVVYCVQAHVLRHLLFKDESHSTTTIPLSGRKTTPPPVSNMKPSELERSIALAKALCEILWRAGEEKKVVITLLNTHSHFQGTGKEFRTDGFIEKLSLYEFDDYAELFKFVRRNIKIFEGEESSGVLLFVYSLILTRDIHRLVHDLEDDKLLTPYDYISYAMVNLMLTGRACPRIIDALLKSDKKGKSQGQLYAAPGVKERSNIGFLFWDKEEEDRKRTKVDTVLRTPRFPIWITHINNKLTGVMFSPSLDLMSDWRREHRFTLYYYTGLHTTKHDGPIEHAKLSIDTREKTGIQFVTKSYATSERERNRPVLEHVIYTKWPGAEIDWHGMMPFV
ncbi:inactive ubiquitin carboxyl-terminal hydrolase MINDY-4B-like isoform X2 [Glandiceps talaboti]